MHGFMADTRTLVRAVASVVRAQGHYSFSSVSGDQDTQDLTMASLCGLTVFFEQEQIIRIKASDMDVVCEGYPPYSQIRFRQGDLTVLRKWHERLAGLQNSFYFSDENKTDTVQLFQAA